MTLFTPAYLRECAEHHERRNDLRGALRGAADEMERLLGRLTKDDTAWLIEFFGRGPPTYYGKTTEDGLSMTRDHNAAVRFARQEDADMVIDDIGWTRPDVQAVEHMWCDGKLHSLAARTALRGGP